jgi:trehalose 6-phosphate synthase
MNLIAKEYVAAQDPADPGVLVLSEFAGSARQLDAAVIVNPHDIDGMAQSIRRALNMTLEERRERWSSMMAVIEKANIHDWYSQFMKALASTAPTPAPAVHVRPAIVLPSPSAVPDARAGNVLALEDLPERAAR